MSCDFISLACPGVQNLVPYQPGKPAEELERELGLTDVIKLASNENPMGPSPRVLDAIKQRLSDISLYPDGGGYRLKQALSDKFSVPVEKLTLGNGSNDVIELIGRAYLNVGDEVIYSEFSFVAYSIVAQAVGATAVITPAKDWGHDLDAMLAAISDRTRMIFIANPNNPTGTWVTRAQLSVFLDQVPEHVLVVLDEAYTEYVDQAEFPNGLLLIDTYPNLIVTRTFSKAYGLAGLRVGFAVSNGSVANVLSRVRQPFNVNSLALAAAEAALMDDAYIEQGVALNKQGMALYEKELTAMGLSYIPSVGNFITVDFTVDAQPIYQAMLAEGVIVRPIASYAMPQHLRISIGLQEENERCLNVLNRVMNP
ncbi:histidinol-phosphate transaminase [Neptuniibacter sp. 2_MG-2023]|uniref:histidinol-phosphate transaminase n=1 Tax=Neptuniibacter sp. 2_MG-2023 TaxID=3062671 RepID=UPI0026E1F479|nr:histidinol-phosphate transaminase [Neptuniibacter sp. 2_MG-2023]MDO6512916.1 histidinol-phosphate transaminase [Neptuniibacter sp. 2_MG-2023]